MEGYVLLSATHSLGSTYLGIVTNVLKLPVTIVLRTNGMLRYNGNGASLLGAGAWVDEDVEDEFEAVRGG